MEANEFCPGTDVGIDSSLDLAADNVGEAWASRVVEVLAQLTQRASQKETHKQKEGGYCIVRAHFFFLGRRRWDW